MGRLTDLEAGVLGYRRALGWSVQEARDRLLAENAAKRAEAVGAISVPESDTRPLSEKRDDLLRQLQEKREGRP